MSDPGPFPVGETLGGGEFHLTEHLCGLGDSQLHLAACPARPGERYLVAVALAPRLQVEPLRQRLAYSYPHILDLCWFGHFDVAGDDPSRNLRQRSHAAMVERLPPHGEWLRALVTGALGAAAAVDLGLAVGRILAAPARDGHRLVAIRPELIWGVRRADAIAVTGLSGRSGPFFAQGQTAFPGSPPLFERSYHAPEIHARRDSREESLVFTLAVMIAEWATGTYPFPDARVGVTIESLMKGHHAPLEVPIQLASILIHALQPDPADRPTLGRFLGRLAQLDPAALTSDGRDPDHADPAQDASGEP
jgi:hypothetical protein